MKSVYYICGMKNLIITFMLLTLGIEGYSQVFTVYVDGLTRFAIPEGLTLYDSADLLIQEQDNYGNEVDRHWGGDNAHYIFDFNEMKMTFTSKILMKDGRVLNLISLNFTKTSPLPISLVLLIMVHWVNHSLVLLKHLMMKTESRMFSTLTILLVVTRPFGLLNRKSIGINITC